MPEQKSMEMAYRGREFPDILQQSLLSTGGPVNEQSMDSLQ